MQNKNEMLLSAGFQIKGMHGNVHYKPSCYHSFSPLYTRNKCTLAWKKQFTNSKQKESTLTFWPPHALQSTFICHLGEALHNGAKHRFCSSPESLRMCGQPSAGSQPDTSPKATFLALRPPRDFQRWKPDCSCHTVSAWWEASHHACFLYYGSRSAASKCQPD